MNPKVDNNDQRLKSAAIYARRKYHRQLANLAELYMIPCCVHTASRASFFGLLCTARHYSG